MDPPVQILYRCLLDPIFLLRTFYLAASALILVIQTVPALRSRFLAYGSRATASSSTGTSITSASTSTSTTNTASPPPKPSSTPLATVLDSLATIRVPHNYFTHFYLLSILCSLFWGWNRGLIPTALLPLTASPDDDPDSEPSATPVGHVQLAWFLMLLQGVRRALESHVYTSSSKSGMWFGHWILGLLFYLTINVAIWVEEVPFPMPQWVYELVGLEQQPQHWAAGQSPASESAFWKPAVLVPAILTAHALQHSYHAYLYRLRTQNNSYKLPSHPAFPNLVCPHYSCEVAIYGLLAFLAAPSGSFVNWTLVSATIFVFVNLGVTAVGTKEWYAERFGAEKVMGRKKMVPWIW